MFLYFAGFLVVALADQKDARNERPYISVVFWGEFKKRRFVLLTGASFFTEVFLLLSVFEGNFAEFLHEFFEFERSFAGTSTCSFVVFFVLESSVGLECFEGFVDFGNQSVHWVNDLLISIVWIIRRR